MKTPPLSSLNNIMARNLLTGDADFVRGLQQMGFRYNNPLEQVTVASNEPPFPQANAFFSEGSFEVSRHSLLQWSLLSSQPAGTKLWLSQLGNLLSTTSITDRHDILSELLTQSLQVNVPPLPHFPAHFPGFLEVWHFLDGYDGQGWDRRQTDTTIFRQLLLYGDVSGEFLHHLVDHHLWDRPHMLAEPFRGDWEQLLRLCVPRSLPALATAILDISAQHKLSPSKLVSPNLLEGAVNMLVADDPTSPSLNLESEDFARSSTVFLALLPHFRQSLPITVQHSLESALTVLQPYSARHPELVSGIQKLLLQQAIPASSPSSPASSTRSPSARKL